MSNRENCYTCYNSIMNLNPKVRFITILEKTGTILFGGQREGIQNFLSEDDQRKSIKHVFNAWFSRINYSQELEKENMLWLNIEKSKDLLSLLRIIIFSISQPSLK